MAFDVRDSRFWEVVSPDAAIEVLLTGLTITEGIVWNARDDSLIFSDIMNSTVYRWTEDGGAVVLRKPSNLTNGNFIDRQGLLVSCEGATSLVSRIAPDGRSFAVAASHYDGRALNSPNDIIVDSRGRIWFTDPPYGRTNPRVGILRPQELAFQGVFRLDPDSTLILVADDFAKPNGLCLTPDETNLLVVDTEYGHIRKFALGEDGGASGGDVFATISGEGHGKPDGIKVDIGGRVYCTGPGGVHVLSAEGELLGVIETPLHTRNLCFGGADFRTLYLAVDTMICRLPMRVQGVAPPRG